MGNMKKFIPLLVAIFIGIPTITYGQKSLYAYYVNGERVYDQTAAIASAEDKLQMLTVSMQKARSSMAAFEAIQKGSSSLKQFDKIVGAYQQVKETLQEATFKN